MMWTVVAESTHNHPNQTESASCLICVAAHSATPAVSSGHSAPVFAAVGILQEQTALATRGPISQWPAFAVLPPSSREPVLKAYCPNAGRSDTPFPIESYARHLWPSFAKSIALCGRALFWLELASPEPKTRELRLDQRYRRGPNRSRSSGCDR